jgi:hypothetical protein
MIEERVLRAFELRGESGEGSLRHMSRALLGVWRQHSWLHDQFWGQRHIWSLVDIEPKEIDLMPLGGEADDFHYPKLDQAVKELELAAKCGKRVNGIHDDPVNLLTLRHPSPLLNRLILVEGQYGRRHFKYAIGDGAHRALSLTAAGADKFEAYLGIPGG